MINLIVIFAKYLVNLSDVECSECADFWVEPESVVASGVACLPAVAEPAHDFVSQEVRVEIAVEVQVINFVDPAFSRLLLARLQGYVQVGREFGHDADRGDELLFVEVLQFLEFEVKLGEFSFQFDETLLVRGKRGLA